MRLYLCSIKEWNAELAQSRLATETGMNRLALNDDDARVRRWFLKETESLGCTVTVDKMGNMFAVKPGKNVGAPTAIGSHLDTQPSGGRYDGILGIHAGIESLRVLDENKYQTKFPVAVVNWTKYVSLLLRSGLLMINDQRRRRAFS